MTPTLDQPSPASATQACETLSTWKGFAFTVRPAAPGDEARLAELFANVTRDDRRFRFLTGIDNVSRDFLERLTLVDHEQTEDYLAFDGERLIATAMLAADAAMERAEVAISIHADYKSRGVGWTLLDHVARAAAAKGIKLIESIESRDNVEAIALEKEMGFTATPYPGDPTLVLVQKTLD